MDDVAAVIAVMKGELLAAMDRHLDRLTSIADKVANDQITLRAEVAALRMRVEALESHMSACNSRHTTHAREDANEHSSIAESLRAIQKSCAELLARLPEKGLTHAAAT